VWGLLFASANLMAAPTFWSGFESNTVLAAPTSCWSTGCWQSITGTDNSTAYAWPPYDPTTNPLFQLLADNRTGTMDPSTIGSYMFNQILPVTGHEGTTIMALYSQVTQSGCCGGDPQGGGATQNNFVLHPTSEPGDTYMSYWFKYQPDLDRQLANGGFRSLFVWKTGTTPGTDDGDYRVVAEVATWNCPGSPTPPYCWLIQADNAAGGNPILIVYWTTTSAVPVPIGEWFKFETFWHRSTGSDGRVWMAVNGQVIVDARGANKITDPINRVYVSTVYGAGAYPQYQWMDDFQIWAGTFPVATTSDPWYDPPYASH
jgi:hypothetical protein